MGLSKCIKLYSAAMKASKQHKVGVGVVITSDLVKI